MRTLLIAVLAAFGLSLVPSTARADLAPPLPPAKDVKFVVELDEKAKAPKLIVPQNLTTVRVRPRPGPGAAPPKAGALPPGKAGNDLSYIELESTDELPQEQPRNPNHLMIAGVALTLALGLGGLWLVRRQGRSGMRGLALLIAAGGTLAASTIVWANVPPPKNFDPPPPVRERVILPVAFDGNVNLEVTFGGDTIRLILDKDTYDKMKKEPTKPAK